MLGIRALLYLVEVIYKDLTNSVCQEYLDVISEISISLSTNLDNPAIKLVSYSMRFIPLENWATYL